MFRADGREAHQLRPLSIESNVSPYAEGSAMVAYGMTKVLVTATVEKDVPSWMKPGQGGWITAEYGMLPRSTHTRTRREASTGKQGGRTLEIQRLIGRSLRQSVSLRDIEGLTIRLDCDVIIADGGTRTASISGAWVALFHALQWCKDNKLVDQSLAICQIAAVSVGVVDGQILVDLAYEEDSNADFDCNLVFAEEMKIVEIQGTGEKKSIDTLQLTRLLDLGTEAVKQIFEVQKEAVTLT